MKNCNYFEKWICILRELKENYPEVNVSRHYTLATADYGDTFSMTDKELFQSLQKYKSELDLNPFTDEQMDKLIQETENLFTETSEDDEELEEE